jgi:hypothetical protein
MLLASKPQLDDGVDQRGDLTANDYALIAVI